MEKPMELEIVAQNDRPSSKDVVERASVQRGNYALSPESEVHLCDSKEDQYGSEEPSLESDEARLNPKSEFLDPRSNL
jgi:hypothetical protein